MFGSLKASRDRSRQKRAGTAIRYEARVGWGERIGLFATGAGLLGCAFSFFQLRDFFVYFFLWPGVLLALWAVGYAVFGHSEAWRFEDEALVRQRWNCVHVARQAWRYNDIVEARIRAKIVENGGCSRVELRVGERWMDLPEQVDREAAERMLATLVARRDSA